MLDRHPARTTSSTITQADVTFVVVALALGALLAYAVIWGAIGGYVLPTHEPAADSAHLARLGLGFAALLTVPVYSVWLIREAFDRAERAACRATSRAAMQTAVRLTGAGEIPTRLHATGSLGA